MSIYRYRYRYRYLLFLPVGGADQGPGALSTANGAKPEWDLTLPPARSLSVDSTM